MSGLALPSAVPLPPPSPSRSAPPAATHSDERTDSAPASPPPSVPLPSPLPPCCPRSPSHDIPVHESSIKSVDRQETSPAGVYDLTAADGSEAEPALAAPLSPRHPATGPPPAAAAAPVDAAFTPSVNVLRLMKLAEQRARAGREAGIDPYTSYRPMVRLLGSLR